MAAGAYVKEAANQARNAIAALEDDIRRIQQETYTREANLKHEASHAETEAGFVRAAEISATSQDQHAAELAARAKTEQLEREAKQKEQEAERLGQEAARTVQAKTGVINGLRSAVSQLEKLASSAG